MATVVAALAVLIVSVVFVLLAVWPMIAEAGISPDRRPGLTLVPDPVDDPSEKVAA